MTLPHPIITLSFDDGHPLDLKLSSLLLRHGLAATFYIPARPPQAKRMTPPQIRTLASAFEIGSHTYSHCPLPGLPAHRITREIRTGKTWLEQVTGKEAPSFCYPGGHFNRASAAVLERLHITYARTTRGFCLRPGKSPLTAGVSLQAFGHTPAIHLRHALKEANVQGILTLMRMGASSDFVGLARALFNRALASNGVFHLWGHSWEIEKYGLWGPLETLFKIISGHAQVLYLTNGQMAKIIWGPAQ